MVNENNIFDKVMLITQFLMKSEVVDLTKIKIPKFIVRDKMLSRANKIFRVIKGSLLGWGVGSMLWSETWVYFFETLLN